MRPAEHGQWGATSAAARRAARHGVHRLFVVASGGATSGRRPAGHDGVDAACGARPVGSSLHGGAAHGEARCLPTFRGGRRGRSLCGGTGAPPSPDPTRRPSSPTLPATGSGVRRCGRGSCSTDLSSLLSLPRRVVSLGARTLGQRVRLQGVSDCADVAWLWGSRAQPRVTGGGAGAEASRMPVWRPLACFFYFLIGF